MLGLQGAIRKDGTGNLHSDIPQHSLSSYSFLKNKIYLLMAVLALHCDAQASRGGGFFCCREWALGTRAQ